MPTIHDLVAVLRQRDGVEAAVVLGRDGLLIDGQSIAGLDSEHIAAHVPSIIQCADDLGAASARGELMTAVLEHERGFAVISALSPDAVLLILVQHTADLGRLLYELRRNRAHIAALV